MMYESLFDREAQIREQLSQIHCALIYGDVADADVLYQRLRVTHENATATTYDLPHDAPQESR